MKERPIIFTSDMVTAILDGKKAQTRFPIKGIDVDDNGMAVYRNGKFTTPGQSDTILEFVKNRCPYGKVGDRLWVREKYRIYDSVECSCYDPCGCSRNSGNPVYYADTRCNEDKWTPSIQMPRWASRITLEITGIRVERVQDMSGVDAKSEGIGPSLLFNLGLIPEDESQSPITDIQARHGFLHLWNSECSKKGFGWDENPWVWVIEFKVVKS